jgi:peptidylprolyl isomerase
MGSFPQTLPRGYSVRRFAVLLLAPVLVGGLLSGCGGGSSGAAAPKGLPSVSGHYGDKPKIKVAKGVKPTKKLVSTVLTKGKGPKVLKGDLLVADYLGSIYKTGKIFDNSYDRKAPAAFPIGVGKVVSGWDKTLVGVTVGSRVEMVLPPKYGYGPKGNTQAGIKGTDSLVFVVDVIARYGEHSATPAPKPVATLPKDLPTVTGTWGTEPKITIPKGTTPATADPKATVLATGEGPAVAAGKLVVTQFSAVSWDGTSLGKTWGVGGPQDVPAAIADLLVGTPVGSRVLLELPADKGADPAKKSVAVVIDIIGQNGTAKQESAS